MNDPIGSPFRQTDSTGEYASKFTQSFMSARIADYEGQITATRKELAQTQDSRDRWRLQERLDTLNRQIRYLTPPSEGEPVE